LPAAAITVAGRAGGASFRASARAPALSRSIDRAKAADSGAPGALGKRRHQGRAHAAALPLVDHLDRHLGLVELLQADVAGDPDGRPRRRRERDQRLVMPVVDVDQALQLAGSQGRLAREVALIPGALAEPAKCERDRASVGGDELADRDARHLAPLTELTQRM
jgi:hypothetical protein